jgi:hypothetical protein
MRGRNNYGAIEDTEPAEDMTDEPPTDDAQCVKTYFKYVTDEGYEIGCQELLDTGSEKD